MHFFAPSPHHYSSETVVTLSKDGRTATLRRSGTQVIITASIEQPASGVFEVATPVILIVRYQDPLHSLGAF